ncbi:MAG: hypothetical protein CL840_18705 [Crocinitomicaceae bacterium]|nr:hypothetical protein [Crocinitomicaceae bacterium]|tara:strand:+ start:3717 stop:4796 length:1080 start_codon:yes stop_codon:yes gene_type:complete
MKKPKDKILIVGGYGTVGSKISEKLGNIFPNKVIVAGRSELKAQKFIDKGKLKAIAACIDLSGIGIDEVNFEEIHTVICCVEYLEDNLFVEKCIASRVNYIELGTSYAAYQRLASYQKIAEEKKIKLIPGVGLMPGLSGVFAHEVLKKASHIFQVKSFVLLGLGDKHGLDAIRFMLSYANRSFTIVSQQGLKKVDTYTDCEKITMLNENRGRRFYRFDLADQHIIALNRGIDAAETRLAFRSRFITEIMRLAKIVGILKWISGLNPSHVKKWLDKFSLGSDMFSVQTSCITQKDEITFLAKGKKEARATAIIASYIVETVYGNGKKNGLLLMEEIIDFETFTMYLAQNKIDIIRAQTKI